jgi:hypothetical protein
MMSLRLCEGIAETYEERIRKTASRRVQIETCDVTNMKQVRQRLDADIRC